MMLMLAALAQPVPIPDAAPAPVSTSEIIIVRGERLRQPTTSTPSISADVLTNQSAVRLDEVLRRVPGVGLFRRTASGAANATIAGLSLRPIAPNGAGRALVSLDGVPQNDPFGGWIYWGRYDPIFLSQIDVRRGGTGAGFGPMALTGTLDLTEARGEPSALSVSYGSFNSAHIAGRGTLRSPGANFTAMGAYDASDGAFSVSRKQRGRVDEPVNFQSLSLALVTDIARDNGAWSFRAAGFSESKGAGLTGGQSSAEGLDVSAARRVEHDLGQARVLIYAQGRDFSNQTMAVTSGRAGAIPALDQYATPSSALGGSFEFVPKAGSSIVRITFDGRRSQGETRERFRYIGTGFTRNRLAGGHQDLVGAGVSLTRPLDLAVGRLTLDGALRLDHWTNRNAVRLETDRTSGLTTLFEAAKDKSGSVMSGRASIGHASVPARLTAYRTFRPPTLNELHRPFRVGNDVTEANAALVPETLSGVDVDLSDRRVVGGGTLISSATVYFNRINNPIANVTLATGPGVLPRVGFLPAGGSLRERRNVGRIDAEGFEGRIGWVSLSSTFNWSLAASWTDARVNGGTTLPQLTGKRPAQAPNWSAVASVTSPIGDDVSLSVNWRAESARFEDDLNTRELDAYSAVDVRVGWRLSGRSELYVSGENIFGATIPTALSGDGIVSVAQGRMLRFGIRIGR